MYFGTEPYGLEGYIKNHGDGSNMYRGEDFGQPRTLKVGDELANGWVVSQRPFSSFNGSVGLKFENGETRLVPARLPLQFNSDKSGVLPAELVVGHILQTGCVILDEPRTGPSVDWRNYQDEVYIKLTGGWEGHGISVPADLPIAVFEEVYPPSTNTELGAFALEQTVAMYETARQHLPKLGQLAIDF